MTHTLTPELAAKFARVALGHVTREFPNKLDHVMAGEGDVKRPRALHPIFYGSFDWHSCVHGYWLLARIYRRFPDLPEAKDIRALFESQFIAEKIAGELAYLARPESRGFERPYGWAWALMLAGELARHQSAEGKGWTKSFKPLAITFADRFLKFLPLATYPVRGGAHGNTAFALILACDYAGQAGDDRLAALCAEKARAWYGKDEDAQAWEPSQDDFLSSTLVEAACMHAVLPAQEFRPRLARFLPHLAQGKPATLFAPATVSDRTDGKIAHLDGLNLSRAWCWRLILDGVENSARARVESAIETHIASALDHVSGDYMGEHWLASFAALALDPWPDGHK